MAQKSQNASNSEGFSNTTATASAPKDAAASGTSRKRSPSSTTMSSATSSILPRMSDPLPPPLRHEPASSQPMEHSTSDGSDSASKDGAGGTASPYGTRSRNRTGTSRPNYAEDKDIDMELYDAYPEKGDDDSKKSTRQTAAAAAANSSSASTSQGTATRPSTASGRKPLPTLDESRLSALSQNAAKEQNSATSANSGPAANPATASSLPATSRKRKAASQSGAGVGQAQSNGTSSQRKAAAIRRNGNGYAETNMVTFGNSGAMPKDGQMVADDGTVLEVNDHVYLVCEPPGEPYYLARIMEFLHAKNDPEGPVDALRVNWYYRPKDIGRKIQDTRLVFATMHSDISPLTSLRGKCQIKHKAEIADTTEYKRSPDCFWYEKLYDRYIQKNYEVIPTSQIVNVPERVKKVLDERWKFILVEQGRGKELTSAVKLCKRCSGYCASNDSVDCAVCQNTYHMNCVRPPLLKKPSRGFAWSCAACSRAQERKLEARHTPNVIDPNHDPEEDEFIDEEEDGPNGADTGRTSPIENEHHEPTAEQIYHASLWPYRYLGIHCKVEDALDYDDRIFPRASTRLGPRHQANVLQWPGHPVQYVKPLEVKKLNKKDGKLNRELQAALESERLKREKRPKWVQDEPPGYIARGEDFENDDPNNTAQLLWRPPADVGVDLSDQAIDDYMEIAKSMDKALGLPIRSTNLQDVARDTLFSNQFNPETALKELQKLDKSVFQEPDLTPGEQKKFDEGIAKFGSELHSVKKHVKTVSPGNIVRYYYVWKKTERGKQTWGNYSSRKGKKEAKKAEATASKLADDVADDHDDSAFDAEKADEKKKAFMCKFCLTTSSRQWRRAPNPSATLVTDSGGRSNGKDKAAQYIQALCRRCAELWRRYAIQWEDMEEVAKKVAQTGGRGWRKRVDEEVYKELISADEMMSNTRFQTPDPGPMANGSAATSQEPPRKKLKGIPEKDADQTASDSGSMTGVALSKKKDKAAEKSAPRLAPEMPKPKTMPCAVCRQLEPLGDQHLSCKECRMTVHRNCYGVIDNRAPGKWTCDMCQNDKNPQISINYKCVLCPVEHTEHDFVEPPKHVSKKKTEKDREREKAEREVAQKAADFYRKKQEEMNRPVIPREPLKRTADNNWVHVTCAVWTPEVKFGLAKALSPSEGIPSIPRSKFAEVCKTCKKQGGACVACHQCRAPVHIECAHQADYLLGFDITPVKGSRRDHNSVVTINGETGTMAAAIWCKDHVPQKTIVHRMHDPVEDGAMNALQLYVQSFKQADLTLTGCARKANQISLAAKTSTTSLPPNPANRRASTTTFVNGDHDDHIPTASQPGGKICLTCGIDVSPKWYPIDRAQERGLTNGHYGNLGVVAQKFVEQRSFQCHKCKKAKRQPTSHLPSKETSSEPEPLRPASRGLAPVRSPSPTPVERRQSGRGPLAWSPRMQAAPLGPGSISAPMPTSAPLQAPVLDPIGRSVMAPAMVAPVVAPPPLPPTMVAPNPHGQGAYRSVSRTAPYSDWHGIRSIEPPQVISPALAPPNLLRPAPMSSIAHPHGPLPPGPPMHTSQMAQPQPFTNGMPPSPRRLSGPPPPVQNGYVPPYHHPPPSHTQEYTNGGGQPLTSILRQRTPLVTPHGSPPVARETLPMNRESSIPPSSRDNRPASGASASPSLRNLLS